VSRALKKKTKTSSANKPTTTREQTNSGMCCRCRHVLPMRRESPLATMNETGRESPMQKKNFPVCQEGLLSVSPSSNNRKFPVCRDGSVCRISRRVSPCKEEVLCRLQMTKRGRSVSPR